MLKLIFNNFKQNKKTTIVFLLSIVLASMLIFIFVFLFSGVHQYLVDEVIKSKGDYHVKIKTDLKGYENFTVIKKIKWQNEYVLITYNDIDLTYKLTNKLCQKTKCHDIKYNDPYLSLYGISKNNNLLKTFKNLIIVVLSLILIASFGIIYNIYKIVLVTKTKQLAIFQNLGMSLKDRRHFLLLETLFFSVIGLTIGFILSILIYLVISNFNSLKFIINMKFLFYAFIFILILVFLICLLPFFKAKKINEKRLHSNHYIKRKKKFKNVVSLIAYLNYKRSKKQYLALIISLIIFLVLSSSFHVFVIYTENIIDKYIKIPTYDFEINALNTKENFDLLKKFAKQNSTKYAIYEVSNKKINIDIEDFFVKGSANLYIIKGNNFFINKREEVVFKDDKIYLAKQKYSKDNIVLTIDNQKLKLKAQNKVPFGFENILNKNNLVIGVNDYPEFSNLTLFMKSNTKNLVKKLDNLLKDNNILYYVDASKGKKIINNIIMVIKFFVFMVLVLVFLISISITISSSYLSIMYRQKEFGLLKSIGFLNKNFKDMLVIESLYITFKAFICSLPIILFINMFFVETINEIIDLKEISIFKPFLLYTLISLLTVRIIMNILLGSIKNTKTLTLVNCDNI